MHKTINTILKKNDSEFLQEMDSYVSVKARKFKRTDTAAVLKKTLVLRPFATYEQRFAFMLSSG